MFNKENLSFILSVISILTAVFVAYRTIYLSRAKIKIIQTDNAARSSFIKSFDGCIKSYSSASSSDIPKDDSPLIVSVLLIEIIITNQSSLPISILEFITKDFTSNPFTSYSYTKDYFTITEKENFKTTIGSKDSPLKFLQPEFTLDGYTSQRGYLMFWSGSEEEFVTPKKITLITETSRKTFKTKIKINNSHESIKKHHRVVIDEDDRVTDDYY